MKNSTLSETTVAARIPKSLKEALVEMARRRPATLSQVIRDALVRAVDWEATMKNEVLLMQCGEALESCISTMVDLGAPTDLCELVKAKSMLAYLNRLFGLPEDVSFSMLRAIFDTAGEDGRC